MFDNITIISKFNADLNQIKNIKKSNTWIQNLYYLGVIIFSITGFILFLGGMITTAIFFSRNTTANIKYWEDKNSDLIFISWIILAFHIVLYIFNFGIAVWTEKDTPRNSSLPLYFFWNIILTNVMFGIWNLILPELNGFVIFFYTLSFVISGSSIYYFGYLKKNKERNRRVHNITQVIKADTYTPNKEELPV